MNTNTAKSWYSRLITRLYQRLKQKEDFVITAGEIPVKKGSRRYTLIVIETKEGKHVLNVGRHGHLQNEIFSFQS